MYNLNQGTVERRALTLIVMISLIFVANTRLILAQEAPIVPKQNAADITVSRTLQTSQLRVMPQLNRCVHFQI
jgi:hypothetical protein